MGTGNTEGDHKEGDPTYHTPPPPSPPLLLLSHLLLLHFSRSLFNLSLSVTLFPPPFVALSFLSASIYRFLFPPSLPPPFLSLFSLPLPFTVGGPTVGGGGGGKFRAVLSVR